MPVSNTILTPTVIANELLMRFENQLGFAKTVSHEYDERFAKIGDTYNLRVPVKYTATKGAAITPQDTKENKIPLTIDQQAHVAFSFGGKDLTLSIDNFAERYLDSAAVVLANTFEVDGLTKAYQSTANQVGSAGTTPATAAVILEAGVKLNNGSAPKDGDRYLALNPLAESKLVDSFKGLFQSSTDIGKQYRTGRMGTALGFDFGMCQNIRTHTVGPLGGTPQVNGASQTGASLSTKGWTAAAAARLKKGDVFTIVGVYAVNRVSGDVLPDLQQFVVTSDFSSAADGTGSVSIYPSIVTSGAEKTVSASPADNANITVVGTASTGYPINIAYHKKAFVFATVPMEVPKGVHMGKTVTNPDTGLSLRMVSDYDITNDDWITRVDILYGWAVRHPEWACRIIG